MKVGDRIEFIAHDEPDPAPLTPGEKGTIIWMGAWSSFGRPRRERQIGVKWDSGRSLLLIQPVDRFRII